VELGQRVNGGGGLVVLEAMKMENEIQASQDGVVTRIYVEPGSVVEKGAPLVELGPSS
jgi:biotin carboxyl carrier protein